MKTFEDITRLIMRIDKEIDNLVLTQTTNTSISEDGVTCKFNDKVQDAINKLLDLRHKYILLCDNRRIMKTFKDLIFKEHVLAKDSSLFKGCKQATLNFDNGYGVSVLFGKRVYSNGIDTYELAVTEDMCTCYDTPITDDVLGYLTKNEVTEAMIKIQEL